MNVAITGASGFLGKHVYKILVKQGFRINRLVHQSTIDDIDTYTRNIRGDLLNKESLLKLVDDADVVFHLAAALSLGEKKKDFVHKINITGTKNIIEVCKQKKVKKLIYLSSIKTLQPCSQTETLDETAPLLQSSKSAYDFSKANAEKLILEAVHDGLDAVILNPTAIIGPGDSQPSYLGKALIQIYNHSLPFLVRGGYNFVDVRNVADAVYKSALYGRKGERYILSGQWLSLKELAILIKNISKNNSSNHAIPLFLARIGLPFASIAAWMTSSQPLYTSESLNNIKNSNKNISNLKACNELGFDPFPIETTLADTFTWFKQHNFINT